MRRSAVVVLLDHFLLLFLLLFRFCSPLLLLDLSLLSFNLILGRNDEPGETNKRRDGSIASGLPILERANTYS
jgi:hypothetical protein